MNRAVIAALVLPLAALGACSSSDESSPTKANAELKPAGEVDAGTAVKVGEFVDLGAGLRVRVSAPKVGGDEMGAWLEVPLRVENSGDDEAYMPSVAIRCENSNESGSYQADSTITFSGQVPGGAFKEGVAHLLLPGDSRTGAPATACTGSAYLEATLQGMVPDSAVPGRWTLGAAIVDELNAAAVR